MRTLALTLLVTALIACGRSGSRLTIQNKGSDTLVNVAGAWAEAYKSVRPDVSVAVVGGGSGTGISALINGTVDIANSSRKMKPREIEEARKNGIEPVEFIVGYDALAVFLHKSNPIDSLTIPQLAEIFGEGGRFTNWGDLGVEFPEAKEGKIVRVSRQNNSGTYLYFKETVLGKNREYELDSLSLSGSTEVVDLVRKTPGAIGYSGLAYATDDVKVAKIAMDEESIPVTPSVTTAVDGTYPIARPLFMYTRGQPTGKVKEYLDWILSEAGQQIIRDKGYAPVPPPSGD
jgi:phosphate transport system substrate-binding protein